MAAVAWMPNQPEANVAFRPGHPASYFSPLCGLPALREEGSRLSSSHRFVSPDSFVSSAQMLFTALPQAETMVLLGYSVCFCQSGSRTEQLRSVARSPLLQCRAVHAWISGFLRC